MLQAVLDVPTVPERQILLPPVRSLRAGKGAAREKHGRQYDQRQGQNRRPRPPRQHENALVYAPLSSSHSRRCPHELRPPSACDAQQCAPVVSSLLLAQALERRLVAGQFRVAPRQHRSPPDQGVIPVECQAKPPHQRPDVVTVPPMRPLVLKHMPERRPIHSRLRRQIHTRPKQSKEAWRLNIVCYVN